MSNEVFFKPFKFKSLNLRNRFVMSPMTRQQSPGGIPTQAVVDYYSRRAKGEVGLIISEGTGINRPASLNDPNVPNFYGAALDVWKNVIDGVHRNHGQMGPQFWHVADVAHPDPSVKPLAPSESPKTMSVKDIENVIEAYAESAAAAKKLGFDCLELHGGHGYLIDQFFWERTNTRTDIFGGKTIGERNHFAVELIKSIRRAIGPEMALILRVSHTKNQDFQARLVNTPKEMEQWLVPLKDAGVDIFHLSQARFWEGGFEGSDLSFSGWAKKITGSPTITVGSVGLSGTVFEVFSGQNSTPKDLDEVARRFDLGEFDLVSVGRAILQDPQWVLKIKENRSNELETVTPASIAKFY